MGIAPVSRKHAGPVTDPAPVPRKRTATAKNATTASSSRMGGRPASKPASKTTRKLGGGIVSAPSFIMPAGWMPFQLLGGRTAETAMAGNAGMQLQQGSWGFMGPPGVTQAEKNEMAAIFAEFAEALRGDEEEEEEDEVD